MPSQFILFTSFSPYHAPLHAFSYVGKNHYDAIVDERALNEAKVLGELNSQDIYEHRKTIERAEEDARRAEEARIDADRHEAAVRLQSHHRARTARRSVGSLRDAKAVEDAKTAAEKAKQEQFAALAIQNAHRARKARAHLDATRNDYYGREWECEYCHVRCATREAALAHESGKHPEEVKINAARLIQSHLRARVARKSVGSRRETVGYAAARAVSLLSVAVEYETANDMVKALSVYRETEDMIQTMPGVAAQVDVLMGDEGISARVPVDIARLAAAIAVIEAGIAAAYGVAERARDAFMDATSWTKDRKDSFENKEDGISSKRANWRRHPVVVPEGNSASETKEDSASKKFNVLLSQNTQDLIGFDDHEHAMEILDHLEVSTTETDEKTGLVRLFFADKKHRDDAIAWIKETSVAAEETRAKEEQKDKANDDSGEGELASEFTEFEVSYPRRMGKDKKVIGVDPNRGAWVVRPATKHASVVLMHPSERWTVDEGQPDKSEDMVNVCSAVTNMVPAKKGATLVVEITGPKGVKQRKMTFESKAERDRFVGCMTTGAKQERLVEEKRAVRAAKKAARAVAVAQRQKNKEAKMKAKAEAKAKTVDFHLVLSEETQQVRNMRERVCVREKIA